MEVFPKSKGAGLGLLTMHLKIARGKELSVTEVRKIWFNQGAGKSKQEIGRSIKRSKTAVTKEYFEKCFKLN